MKGIERRGRHKDRPPDRYAIANVTPVAKCVGAFLRPCERWTSAVLCEECWDKATDPEMQKAMGL